MTDPAEAYALLQLDWLLWRGWRRLVGHESFFYSWRSAGGIVPVEAVK